MEAPAYLYTKFVYPSREITMTGSIYMTLALALERCISTNRNIAYQLFSSSNSSYVTWYFKYVFPVTLFSTLFYIPRFFHFIVCDYEHHMASNTSDNTCIPIDHENGAKVFVKIAEFGTNDHYETYYVKYGTMIITEIIPFLCLLSCGVVMFKKLKELRRGSSQSENHGEYGLAMIMIVIVITFIICHIPRIGNYVHYIYITSYCDSWTISNLMVICHELAFLLLTINSSVKVVIYCCFDKKFKSAIFCIGECKRKSENNLNESNMDTQMVELFSRVEEN